MHELSIALEIARIADESAAQVGAGRVVRVHVAVGALAGVDPDALAFAWEAARAERARCRDAALQLCRVPVRVFCPQCGTEAGARPHSVACERCGSLRTWVVAGEELEVTAVEVEVDGAGDGACPEAGAVAQRPTGGSPAG